MPLLADDDVVVHGDAERLGDSDNCLRHLDVRAGRSGVSRWMIVHQEISAVAESSSARLTTSRG